MFIFQLESNFSQTNQPILASYEYDSDRSEIEELSEQLFRESEPNIFPYVKVNLQSSTSSWSDVDDADSP